MRSKLWYGPCRLPHVSVLAVAWPTSVTILADGVPDIASAAVRRHKMVVVRAAFVQGSVNNKMPVGHCGNHAQFMTHKQNGGTRCNFFQNAVDALLEMLVKIAQRLIEHQHPGA